MSLPTTRLGLKGVAPLIVDDNVQSLDLVSAILMGFGINKAVKCGSAAEARDALLTRAFDLIIVDCEMPDEDGYKLIRHIRGDPQAPNFTAPVLMMSALTPRSKIEAARDGGANFTIAKPVSPTTLLQRMLWIAQSRSNCVTWCQAEASFRTFCWSRMAALRATRSLRATATMAALGAFPRVRR